MAAKEGTEVSLWEAYVYVCMAERCTLIAHLGGALVDSHSPRVLAARCCCSPWTLRSTKVHKATLSECDVGQGGPALLSLHLLEPRSSTLSPTLHFEQRAFPGDSDT